MTRLAAVALLLAAPWCAAQPTLRVRVWAAHPTAHVDLVPSPEVRLRACAECPAKTLRDVLAIDAAGGRVRVAGETSAVATITGAYRLASSGEGDPIVYSAPLEIRASSGRLVMVLTVSAEEYVADVLAAEAGTFRSAESLKAMAVAVRTFAAHFRGRHAAEGFDLCDSTHCQAVRWAAPPERLTAAVAATDSELVWFRAAPAATYYHRSCGGVTEDGSAFDRTLKLPYLVRQEDPACSVSRDEWRSELGKDEIRRALAELGVETPARVERVAIVGRTASGRAARLSLGNGSSVKAEQLRRAIGRGLGWDRIRSDLYEISDNGAAVIFHGRGQGHGVGLCQAGAAAMGDQGKSYREILAFYYPGTNIGLTPRGLPWQWRGGEQVDLFSTDAAQDARLLAAAERARRRAQQATGLSWGGRVQVRVYPTVEAFRNSTGEPGWVAAVTRGHTIRLQPAAMLERLGTVDGILRHEFLHVLFEERTHAALPLWFREGLALDFAGEEAPKPRGEPMMTLRIEQELSHPTTRDNARRAYEDARLQVVRLREQYGDAAVLGWLNTGLPARLLRVGGGAGLPRRR